MFSTVDHTLPRTVWQNKVTRVEARDHSLPEVRAIKEAKWEQKVQEVSKARQAPGAGAPKAITPVVGSNFEGNWSVYGVRKVWRQLRPSAMVAGS